MPSVAIYGDSGMGKTMIMKRFRDEMRGGAKHHLDKLTRIAFRMASVPCHWLS